MPTNPETIVVEIDALGGAAPMGSSLRVRILDTTAVDELGVEVGYGEIGLWDGSACALNIAAPEFLEGRDYVVIAHAGTSSDFATGDWLTTDHVNVTGRAARVSLHQI